MPLFIRERTKTAAGGTMKLKLTVLAAVFAAGLTASFALADDGHGHGHGDQANHAKCSEVHINGTIAPQAMTVTLGGRHGSKKLNLAPGSQVQIQVGAAGQTVNVNAEACMSGSGSAAVLQVKSLVIHPSKPKHEDSTTATTTTAPTTTP
jgi:hypothetical protein